MVGKKGYMRSFEVIIAIIIFGSFLLFILPSFDRASAQNRLPEEILDDLKYSSAFDDCVDNPSDSCITETIGEYMKDGYDYIVIISDDPYKSPENLDNESYAYSSSNIVCEVEQ